MATLLFVYLKTISKREPSKKTDPSFRRKTTGDPESLEKSRAIIPEEDAVLCLPALWGVLIWPCPEDGLFSTHPSTMATPTMATPTLKPFPGCLSLVPGTFVCMLHSNLRALLYLCSMLECASARAHRSVFSQLPFEYWPAQQLSLFALGVCVCVR